METLFWNEKIKQIGKYKTNFILIILREVRTGGGGSPPHINLISTKDILYNFLPCVWNARMVQHREYGENGPKHMLIYAFFNLFIFVRT